MAEHERTITLPEVEVCLRTDGIVTIDYRVRGQVDLEIVRRAIAASRQLSTSPRPMLVRLGGIAGLTREARRYLAESHDSRAVASRTALVADTSLARVIGRFVIGFNRPAMPTRLFDGEPEAIAWLAAG